MLTRITTPILVALVMVLASTAIAQPASELLEKAIFTEETVGDLDAAIGIYKQILDDAQANRKLAAQAQLRLAMCYLKKGRDTEATEAFEKLIENYPDQKELITEARKRMPGRLELGPVPWQDGEVARMIIKLPTGLKIGTFAWSQDRVVTDEGKDAWRLQTRRYLAINGTQGVSGVDAEPETFRPLSSWFAHTLLGETNAVYTPTEVQLSGTGREDQEVSVAPDELIFDNEQAVQLIRRLPLEVGYKTTLPIFVTFSGKQLDVTLEVEAKDTLTVPAGEFESYKVVLEVANLLHQEFWFSADANRYPIKFSAEGIIGELISVSSQGGDGATEFEDEKLGFSLTVPAAWYIYDTDDDETGRTRLHLIHPDAMVFCVVNARTIESTELDTTQPVRTFAEERAAKDQKRSTSYAVRPDSWVEHTVNGMPAASFIADFVDQGNEMVDYRTYVLGETTVARLETKCQADDFDTIKPVFDQIIASYKAK